MKKNLIRAVVGVLCAVTSIMSGITAYAKKPGWLTYTDSDRKLVLVGDSRTVGMYNSYYENEGKEIYIEDENDYFWSAKVGAGYSWFKDTGLPAAEKELEDNTDIVILMGVNDCRNVKIAESYATLINDKTKEWAKKYKDINVYYVSLNPISEDTIYSTTNDNVETWNKKITSLLSKDVTYIDTYDIIEDTVNYSTDGLHYQSSTYKYIYKLVLNDIEENIENA